MPLALSSIAAPLVFAGEVAAAALLVAPEAILEAAETPEDAGLVAVEAAAVDEPDAPEALLEALALLLLVAADEALEIRDDTLDAALDNALDTEDAAEDADADTDAELEAESLD